jgi:hypothetical protein
VTELLRCSITAALFIALVVIDAARSTTIAAPPKLFELPSDAEAAGSVAAAEIDTTSQPPPETAAISEALLSESPPISNAPNAYEPEPTFDAPVYEPSDSPFSKLRWLGLRHSSTHGRSAGLGIPLTGTSWLNRPYYVGADIGTVWLTRPVKDDFTDDTDMFGGIFGGCDWDHYWGTELAVHRATPEIINENDRDADRGDRLMEWTASLMYYPWGDAVFRPYWRLGIGATDFDFPDPTGNRQGETLWTFPIGVGLKYPFRRWLAARAEFADQLALGNSGLATQHDLTLTVGLEWRFGVHPRSYWPWNPSRHIW